MIPVEKFKILLIEDDELDLEKFERSMRRIGIDNDLIHATDGINALEILRGEGENQQPLRGPLVALLDLNMPRMNGHEFLSEVRNDERLQRLSVFVMSTSDRPQDINTSYDHHVNGYLIKPFTMQQTYDTVEALHNYWSVLRFPSLE
ncbi:MAG: response regulator [Woeseiaceae bacterium]